MTAQTPPVVTAELIQRIAPSEALLRAIQAGGWASLGDLADKSGRPAHNMKRDLGRLEESGLVDLGAGKDKPALTAVAVAGLAAIDALANPVRDADPRDFVGLTSTWTHRDFTNNPDQPRKKFDDAAVAERAASMKAVGQLQNLLARPNPDKTPGAPALQIVAGETRWRAAGLLIERGDWPADHPIKTDVRDLTDEQVDRIALAENVQRSDLTTMEEARAYARMMKKYGWTTDQVADEVDKDRRTVQLRLRLLRLTPEQQQQLEDGEINYTQAQKIIDALPKPLDLTPGETVILAEVVAVASGDRPAAYHHWAECSPTAAAAPGVADLIERKLLKIDGPDHFTGRFKVMLTDFTVFDRLADQYPGLRAADRSSALLAIRAAAFGADEAERLDSEGAFATAWLNGPFELTDEGKAIVEQRRQEAAQNAVRAGEADAQRALRMKRLSEADGQTSDLLKALAKPRASAAIEGLTEISQALEAPLPWTFCERRHDGWPGLIDANGAPVHLAAHMGPTSVLFLKLAMAALNAAAGFAPVVVAAEQQQADKFSPSTDAAAEDFDPEREPTGAPEFWTWVGARLQRMHAVPADRVHAITEAAEKHLEAEGVTFGDESMTWNLGDGVAVADDYAADFPELLGAPGEDAADDQGHRFEEDDGEEA